VPVQEDKRADPLLSIGVFARRSRLSPKALRLYAAQGLLVPARLDGRTGYRSYTADQVERARLIGLLRQAGMPLARVRELVASPASDQPAAVERWWAGVEDDHRRRREVVAHLHRRLTGEDLVMDVVVREVPEQELLTAERRVTVEDLEPFITGAADRIRAHLAAAGTAPSGALRVVYHGMVTEDSDGPVEVAVPFTGSVEPVDDLRVRLQPAQREAVTALTREQACFPRILDAYDAVARWTDGAGLSRTGSPAEVYPEDDGPVFLEVAWPVG